MLDYFKVREKKQEQSSQHEACLFIHGLFNNADCTSDYVKEMYGSLSVHAENFRLLGTLRRYNWKTVTDVSKDRSTFDIQK
jgi:hypothetical protein